MDQSLYCFDCDGVLDCEEMENESDSIKGVIRTSILIELEKRGSKIAIVSPSSFLPKAFSDKTHWFADYINNEDRIYNILKAIEFHNLSKEDVVYVDDMESNRQMIESHGIRAIDPEDFIQEVDIVSPEDKQLTDELIEKHSSLLDKLAHAD